MSTPPNERPPPDREPDEQAEPERRSTHPLVWLILLIALAAIAWYFASQREAPEVPLEPVVPAEDIAADGTGPDGFDVAPADETAASGATSDPADGAPSGPALADRPATPLARVQPSYPAAALRSREEGTVLLRVEVDAGGNPTSVDVERSSRSRDLDRAARDAVSQWTFQPAVENGQPVASTVTVPVDFRVEEQ